MFGWNVLEHIRDAISRIFGFPFITTWKHFKYLGMPIFLNSSHSQPWQDILDKIAARIQSLGGKWLNPIGKIVLLKSFLSSLTIFSVQVILDREGILEKISRSLCTFMWEGGKSNTKKIHLIN
jgi:hypothetical protein